MEVSATGLGHLEGDGLASGAREGGDNVAVTGGDGDITKVLGDRGGVVVGGGAASDLRQLGEVNLAVTAEGVVGSLEISLLGEHEDQVTGRTLVRGGDVEVEEGRDGLANSAEVLGAVGGIGGGGVDGDDQVGVLVLAGGEGGGTAAGRRLGSGSRGRRLDSGGAGSGDNHRASGGSGSNHGASGGRNGLSRSHGARGGSNGLNRGHDGGGEAASRSRGLNALRGRGGSRGAASRSRAGRSGCLRVRGGGTSTGSREARGGVGAAAVSNRNSAGHVDRRAGESSSRRGRGRASRGAVDRSRSRRANNWGSGRGVDRGNRAGSRGHRAARGHRDARSRRSSRGHSRGRSSGTGTRARVSSQLDILAHGNGSAVGGVDVTAIVLSSLAGNEVRAVVVFQATGRGDGETSGGIGTSVTLELGSFA